MWNLHQIYIQTLKPQGKHMSFREAIKYVNNIHPAKLMYSVNYLFRKTKDEKIIETKVETLVETMVDN
jgi:hypothetical protein